MTLDEAIKHCEEIADDESRFYNQEGFASVTVEHCKCAEEHRQLAEWLKELKALKEQGLQPTCNQLATDTISRQQAIDALTEYGNGRAVYIGVQEAVRRIEQLPPAQPEIIRCEDCRYSVDEYGDGDCYCKRPSRELVWIGGRWDFFCAAAKRRDRGGA